MLSPFYSSAEFQDIAHHRELSILDLMSPRDVLCEPATPSFVKSTLSDIDASPTPSSSGSALSAISTMLSPLSATLGSPLSSPLNAPLNLVQSVTPLALDSNDEEDDLSPFANIQHSAHSEQRYIIQPPPSCNQPVRFDKVVEAASNDMVYLLDSEGLSHGRHEWSIKVDRSDGAIQEIGVIATSDIENRVSSKSQIGARAVYGNKKQSRSVYAASFNKNGKRRCYRSLSNELLSDGDVLEIKLDLTKWKIKFYLNGVKVRSAMKLQRSTYYPMISFAGDCRYKLCL